MQWGVKQAREVIQPNAPTLSFVFEKVKLLDQACRTKVEMSLFYLAQDAMRHHDAPMDSIEFSVKSKRHQGVSIVILTDDCVTHALASLASTADTPIRSHFGFFDRIVLMRASNLSASVLRPIFLNVLT